MSLETRLTQEEKDLLLGLVETLDSTLNMIEAAKSVLLKECSIKSIDIVMVRSDHRRIIQQIATRLLLDRSIDYTDVQS